METGHMNLEHMPGQSVSLSPRHPVTASSMSPAKIGMLSFLCSEVAFFGTLIMVYVYFLPQTRTGTPSPRQVFSMSQVLIASACLFASSFTVHRADRAFRRGARDAFLAWWGVTILLGLAFLTGTGLEWTDLINNW